VQLHCDKSIIIHTRCHTQLLNHYATPLDASTLAADAPNKQHTCTCSDMLTMRTAVLAPKDATARATAALYPVGLMPAHADNAVNGFYCHPELGF
jgi:hypothetical protein